MKIVIMLVLLLIPSVTVLANGYDNPEWKDYVQGEIAHKRKLKELEAIHRIYADQIILAKSNYTVNNSMNNGSYSHSTSQATAEASFKQKNK